MGIHVSKKGNDMQRFRREKISTSDHTRPRRRRLAGLLAVSLGLLTALVAGPTSPVPSVSAQAPVGQGFNLNESDLRFILKQIKIAEHHATATGRRTCAAPCSVLAPTRSRTTGSA